MKKILLRTMMLLLITFSIVLQGGERPHVCDAVTWEQELNKINWLVLKASSLNVINGLYINTYQAQDLLQLARQVESEQLPYIYEQECSFNELTDIDVTFRKVLVYLRYDKPLPDDLKNEVDGVRASQSQFVRRTIVETQRQGYMANNCMQCHAMPQHFAPGDERESILRPISEKERRNIDRVHIEGIFGNEGVRKVWELKSDVDRILTKNQNFLLKDFRCCLIPPNDLINRMNPSRLIMTNQWNTNLLDVRNLPKAQWRDFKPQYLASVFDYIEVLRPGIKLRDKQAIVENFSIILERARKMNLVDYELNQDSLCLNLKNQLRVDRLSIKSKRPGEERQFINAMLLLFPGSSEVYERIIRRNNKEFQVGYYKEKY